MLALVKDNEQLKDLPSLRRIFRPIAFLIRLTTGKDLPLSSAPTTAVISHGVSMLHSILMLSLSFGFAMYWSFNLCWDILKLSANSTNEDAAVNKSSDMAFSAATSIVDYVPVIIYYFGMHLTFFLITFGKPWNQMWGIIQEITKEYQEIPEFNQKMKKTVRFGLFIFFSVYEKFLDR